MDLLYCELISTWPTVVCDDKLNSVFTCHSFNDDKLSLIFRPVYKGDMICYLTHWGRVTNICVGNLTSLGPDNGLSPGRRQSIIWTDAGILLIGPLGTNFSEILIDIHTFSFTKMHLKMSSAKCRPFCLGLNVLIHSFLVLVEFDDGISQLLGLHVSFNYAGCQFESISLPFRWLAHH